MLTSRNQCSGDDPCRNCTSSRDRICLFATCGRRKRQPPREHPVDLKNPKLEALQQYATCVQVMTSINSEFQCTTRDCPSIENKRGRNDAITQSSLDLPRSRRAFPGLRHLYGRSVFSRKQQWQLRLRSLETPTKSQARLPVEVLLRRVRDILSLY